MIPIPTRRQSLGLMIIGTLIMISSVFSGALSSTMYRQDGGMIFAGAFMMFIIGAFLIYLGNRQVIDMERFPTYLADFVRVEFERLKKSE